MSDFFRKRPRPSSLARTTSKRQICQEPTDSESSEQNSQSKSATSSESSKNENKKEPSILHIQGEEIEISKPLDFLHNCGICGRPLGSERDIYIYRGESAFCSIECRALQIRCEARSNRR